MIGLMLCCNNEQGNFTGKITSIEFHDKLFETLISFESADDDSICDCKIESGSIKLDKKEFKFKSYTPYVGNIMWDSCWMADNEANKIWEYLLTLKDRIQIDSGLSELWSAWEYGLQVDFKKYHSN